MKKLPIGIQSIEPILSGENYVYVDKTGFIKRLIEEGAPHYFMSRPRRFGKSLFLNTLEEIFKGNKELFKECQIYNSDYQWEEHPVLYFDFAQIANKTPQELMNGLQAELERMGQFYGISVEGPSIQFKLKELVEELAKKNRVVVLVDEYDQPIISNLKNPEIAEQNRDLLRDFFGTLKSLDRHLRFTFVTGVSKFSHVSLFSGPNNLKDITMDPRYAAMMGYTKEELENSFSDHIQAIAEERGLGIQNILEEVREWYNGYRFSRSEACVYNPFSTLNFMDEKEPASYWYSSGTPSFLIDQVKKHPQAITSLRGTAALRSTLSDISRFDRINLPALMFQTGYLTIQDYNPEESSYTLDFPNKEVRWAFFNSLLQEFTELDPLEVVRASEALRKDLDALNVKGFISKINNHFAKMAYPLFAKAKEGFYQAVFFTLLEKSGIRTTAEVATNIGRIDLICETAKAIWIFELKLDQPAEAAFDQTEDKKYREGQTQKGKDILVLGISFSSKSRNIGEWKGALYSPSGEFIRTIE